MNLLTIHQFDERKARRESHGGVESAEGLVHYIRSASENAKRDGRQFRN